MNRVHLKSSPKQTPYIATAEFDNAFVSQLFFTGCLSIDIVYLPRPAARLCVSVSEHQEFDLLEAFPDLCESIEVLLDGKPIAWHSHVLAEQLAAADKLLSERPNSLRSDRPESQSAYDDGDPIDAEDDDVSPLSTVLTDEVDQDANGQEEEYPIDEGVEDDEEGVQEPQGSSGKEGGHQEGQPEEELDPPFEQLPDDLDDDSAADEQEPAGDAGGDAGRERDALRKVLEGLSKRELAQEARKAGISVTTRMRPAEVIDQILEKKLQQPA